VREIERFPVRREHPLCGKFAHKAGIAAYLLYDLSVVYDLAVNAGAPNDKTNKASPDNELPEKLERRGHLPNKVVGCVMLSFEKVSPRDLYPASWST